MRSRWLKVAALLGLLAAAACGTTERDFGTGGAGTGGGGGAGGGGGHATTGEGPQLVSSIPADGDMQASLSPYVLLYFDRPVSFASATGKIVVSNDAHPDPTPVQTFPCPDNDPTCVAAVYPDTFAAPPGSSTLPGSTQHTVTIDKSFPDPDGKTNDVDTTIRYTTFPYDPNFFDDSAAINSEAGGLDYDPASNAIFVCGEGPAAQGIAVRKIQLQGDTPSGVTTAADLNVQLCYGVDAFNGTLHVNATYGDTIFRYGDTSGPTLPQPSTFNATGLPAPNDVLGEVRTTAMMNGLLYAASGSYHGGPAMSGVLRMTAAGGWEVFVEGAAVGYDPEMGVGIAIDQASGHLYIAAESTAKIYKVRIGDKQLVNSQDLGDGGAYDIVLRVDSSGRLYVGSSSGLVVYDTSGSNGFT
ncbi:MAG: hypothetical protein IT372_09010, partial [Polyangiaceae bacterium]|nr:hypothetical protein [Polyangiaceae bacterium]